MDVINLKSSLPMFDLLLLAALLSVPATLAALIAFPRQIAQRAGFFGSAQ